MSKKYPCEHTSSQNDAAALKSLVGEFGPLKESFFSTSHDNTGPAGNTGDPKGSLAERINTERRSGSKGDGK